MLCRELSVTGDRTVLLILGIRDALRIGLRDHSFPIDVYDRVWVVRCLPVYQDRCVQRLCLLFLSRPEADAKPANVYTHLGSILPSIASHIFCNMMGFPDPVGAIESFPQMKGRESSGFIHRCEGIKELTR